MTQNATFSQRNNFNTYIEPKIKVRYEAPDGLKEAIIVIAQKNGLNLIELRGLICKELLKIPDIDHNWGANQILSEIISYIEGTNWYKIYDIIEKISMDHKCQSIKFTEEINDYFRKYGGDHITILHQSGINEITKELNKVLSSKFVKSIPIISQNIKEIIMH